MEIVAKILVRGIVQGVGFRYFVYRKAKEMGVQGFVKNRGDGSVYIEVVAGRPLIEELINALRGGPREAHVTDVEVEWETPAEQYRDFEIR